MTLTTPLMFTSITRENSSAGTFQSGALRLIVAALFTSRSGGPPWKDFCRPRPHVVVVSHVDHGEAVRGRVAAAQLGDRLRRASTAEHDVAAGDEAIHQRPSQPSADAGDDDAFRSRHG